MKPKFYFWLLVFLLFAVFLVSLSFKPANLIPLFLFSGFGFMLPDIDIPFQKTYSLFKTLALILAILFILVLYFYSDLACLMFAVCGYWQILVALGIFFLFLVFDSLNPLKAPMHSFFIGIILFFILISVLIQFSNFGFILVVLSAISFEIGYIAHVLGEGLGF